MQISISEGKRGESEVVPVNAVEAYVCVYVCMYVFMYVLCVYIHTFIYLFIYSFN